MDPEGLINHIVTFINSLRHKPSDRLRIAVSPEEHLALREYMFSKYGKFYDRIANIPLVIEPTPDKPPLTVEFKP